MPITSRGAVVTLPRSTNGSVAITEMFRRYITVGLEWNIWRATERLEWADLLDSAMSWTILAIVSYRLTVTSE